MLTAEAVHRHEDERRSCRRATLQWVVLVFFGGDQWGKLVDLSEKGMCFQFEHPPALRQSISFTFEAMGCMAIPSEGHEGSVFGDSIQATGRVKWTREFERIAGVEFLELSARSRDQIRYWISSGASQEAAAPSRELQHEWNKKKSKKADRKTAPFTAAALTAAPHAPVEPAPSPAKAPFELREEVFESDRANGESDIEVVWEPEPSLAPPTIDEHATPHKKWAREREPERDAAFTPVSPDEPAISPGKWSGEAEPEDSYTSPTLEGPAEDRRKWPVGAKPESAFAPPDLDEPAASPENWPAEPEPSFLPPALDEATAVELREKLDALSHRKRTLEPEPEDAAMPPSLDEPEAPPRKWDSRSEPAPAPEEFVPSDRRGFWGSKDAFASQPLDFEAPGMLHHDERQRRGQTLELKQHRARFGVIAVLGLLGTLGALAGIIRFTSKFNERADATDVSRPSENNVASGRGEGGARGAASPFLVEVVDANNHRSVIVFSAGARSNKSGHVQDSSLSETSVMAVQEPSEETKTSATKREASRDFTLIAPHAATSVAGAGANSAVEAPALTTQVPASPDAPLQNLPSPAMPGAADRAPAVGGEVQPARLIHAVLPTYPQIARSSRVAGDVTLDALVDESGNVLDVKVIAGPLLLRDAAMEALRQWKYEPARLDGQPTPMHLTVTVKFQNGLASH